MPDYILALDQGTTSSRAIVFDRAAEPLSFARRDIPQNYPHQGWVEHDPETLWTTVLAVGREAIAKAAITARDIAAIGIANQRETTIMWERKTGVPIYPAIVWQDRRTAERCDELRDLEDTYSTRTGLRMDPYFSGTKIAWILRNVRKAAKRAEKGELAFGTVDSWLIWKLTGGRLHVTDVTNASRTLIYRIDNLEWSEKLMSFLDIPHEILPRVVASSGVVGETDPTWFGASIPIAGIAGDQQAALFGQACFRAGMAKNTYGTGSFLLRHTGKMDILSENRLLSTPVAGNSVEEVEYAAEGSTFSAGSAVDWLRDGLGILRNVSESAAIAESVGDTDGVYMIPSFTGLGAPYWDPEARGAIVGLTRGSGRAHIIRAALENMAYHTRDVVEAMDRDFVYFVEQVQQFGTDWSPPNPEAAKIKELRVDGGACVNDFLMQFQADILGIPVIRPRITETTALGAAFLAGLAVGFWSSRDEVEALWRAERTFEPEMDEDDRESLYEGWLQAVARVETQDQFDDIDDLLDEEEEFDEDDVEDGDDED